MHREQPAADLAARNPLLRQLRQARHVPGHPLRVDPTARQRLSAKGLRDGVLVFVVREDQLAAADVQIEALAQMLHGHGRRLDMPGRPYVAPLAADKGAALELGQAAAPKECEVSGVLLFVILQVDGGAHPHLGRIDARQPAVTGHPRQVEIKRSQLLVGQPFVGQLAGQGRHVLDVVTAACKVAGRPDAQPGQVLQKSVQPPPRFGFRKRPLPCAAGLLQVHDVDGLLHGQPPPA